MKPKAGNFSVYFARKPLAGVYGLSVGLSACLQDESFVFHLRGLPVAGGAAGGSVGGWGGLLEGRLMQQAQALVLHNTQSTHGMTWSWLTGQLADLEFWERSVALLHRTRCTDNRMHGIVRCVRQAGCWTRLQLHCKAFSCRVVLTSQVQGQGEMSMSIVDRVEQPSLPDQHLWWLLSQSYRNQ